MNFGYSLAQRLIDAVFLEDPDEVWLLLRQGASPEERDEERRTPLMAATLAGNARIVRLLLDAGCDLGAADDDGWTALHMAAHRQRLDLVWMLIQAGADPNAQDHDGNSALWRATLTSFGRTAVVDLLRRNGARDDLPNRRGLTASSLARRLKVAFAARSAVRAT